MRELSAVAAQRDELTKKTQALNGLLDRCESSKQGIIDRLRTPTAAPPQAPAKLSIKPEELEEIKKQALQEAEEKYKTRIKSHGKN